MPRNLVAPSARASRPEDKTQDDRDFKGKWIAFGMSLKGRADGYGINWRKMSFEKFISAVEWADDFAGYKQGEAEHA